MYLQEHLVHSQSHTGNVKVFSLPRTAPSASDEWGTKFLHIGELLVNFLVTRLPALLSSSTACKILFVFPPVCVRSIVKPTARGQMILTAYRFKRRTPTNQLCVCGFVSVWVCYQITLVSLQMCIPGRTHRLELVHSIFFVKSEIMNFTGGKLTRYSECSLVTETATGGSSYSFSCPGERWRSMRIMLCVNISA